MAAVLLMETSAFDALMKRQEEMEDAGLGEGSIRFRKNLEKASGKKQKTSPDGSTVYTNGPARLTTVNGGAKTLLLAGLNKLDAGIKEFLRDAHSHRGVRHCAVQWIELLGQEAAAWEIAEKELKGKVSADNKAKILARHMDEGIETASFMTLKVILDAIEQRRPVTRVATEVTDLITDELRYRRFKRHAPGLFEYKMRTFQTSSYQHMARSLTASMNYAQIDCSDLIVPQAQRVLVGAKLIDLLMLTTGLIEIVVAEESTRINNRGKKRERKCQHIIQAAPDTLEWITKRNGVLEDLMPVNLPMVVPPLQWSTGHRGGYRFAMRNKYSIVRGQSPASTAMLEAAQMPVVYQALNAIQNTAWKINAPILAVITAVAGIGGGLAGVPYMVPEEMPAKPFDIAENETARKAWRKQKHEIVNKNLAQRVRFMEFDRVRKAAERVVSEAAIFFPHSLDFRGRIYPVSSFISPQGDDLSKGLLTFAQGKPLGPDGYKWLAIHGANCMDTTPEGQKVSRMTLDQRIAWVFDHAREIIACANAPLENRWWTHAEEPLQFLAFCMEWRGYNDGGDEYVCSLPVSQDGSCNGLQHFSAMFKDPIGGEAVNVVAQETPQDVYLRVAELVLNKLTDLASTGDILAGLWLTSGVVNRKLCKRPTMTFGYGSKPYGFQEQLLGYLQKDLSKDPYEAQAKWEEMKTLFSRPDPEKPDEMESLIVQACALMAQMIWQSLQEIVVAAFAGMAWFQKAARSVVKSGAPLTWTVPGTGFPVRQEYYVMNKSQVKTMLAGKVVKPVVYSPTKEIETYKQANAVAPNVVHSLDAAALMLTVKQAMDDGVEHFAVVHDSYGTVPGSMAVLSQATRQGFVKLYTSHDVIGDLHAQFQLQAPEGVLVDLPPLKGTLEVSQVLTSAYFFC